MAFIEENRKRKHIVKARLSDEEFEKFNDKVKKSKLSKEEFIRSAIFKMKIIEPPDLNYYQFKTEINKIGINLNQLLKYRYLPVEEKEIQKVLDDLNHFIEKLDQQIWGRAHGIY